MGVAARCFERAFRSEFVRAAHFGFEEFGAGVVSVVWIVGFLMLFIPSVDFVAGHFLLDFLNF